MDKAKILRLCNEIEDEVTDIAFNSTHKHIYDCCESIREYLKAISAEITAPPKSNADRIRQMTDEELADVMQGQCACCAYQLTGCTEKECKDGAYEWLRKETDRRCRN